MLDIVGSVAGGLFILGAAYYAGRISARVDRLEEARGEIMEQFKEVHGHLHRIESLCRAGKD